MDSATQHPTDRKPERPQEHPPRQEKPVEPWRNPGPRGNQAIDEYDLRRGQERFLSVIGH